MIDRLGKCPSCKISWDDGDTLSNLNKMDIFTHKMPADMMKIAAGLGYSETNRNKFSKVKVHERDGVVLYECPNMRCGHVFNITTGEEYDSMYDYKNNSPKRSYKLEETKIVGAVFVHPDGSSSIVEAVEDECPFEVDKIELLYPKDLNNKNELVTPFGEIIKKEEDAKEKSENGTDIRRDDTGDSSIPQKGRWGR